jgi:hypothetical protein
LALVDLVLLLEKSLALTVLILFLVLLLLLAADMERVLRFHQYPEALGVAAVAEQVHIVQALETLLLHHLHRVITEAPVLVLEVVTVAEVEVALAQ